MRDPSELYTRRGVPVIVFGSRLLLVGYFIVAAGMLRYNIFPESHLSYVWLVYLAAMYYLAERLYRFFGSKNIDLSFAFPLVLAMYVFNLVSLTLNAQEVMPIINRAEHFVSFVLLGYVTWIFFLQYLPPKVWRQHLYHTATMVLAMTALYGVVNELVELLFDTIFGTRLIGSRLDTPLDLLMNTLGTGTFLAVRLILGAAEEGKRYLAESPPPP